MAGIMHTPQALFVTAPNLSLEALNTKLAQLQFDDVANLWLINSTSYNSLPRPRTDNRLNLGTHAPITSFTSPFAGQTINEVAVWLSSAPPDVDIDCRFFAVLDDFSVAEDSVQACRIGDGKGEGEKGVVQWYPVTAQGVWFSYRQSGDFDADLKGYVFNARRAGLPDRSSGQGDTGLEGHEFKARREERPSERSA